MDIKELEYENYGKCVSISNGVVEAVVTVEVGPRIIRFGFCGERNLLYNDLARRHSFETEESKALYGDDCRFQFYGGHRLWLSPESGPATYYPDNRPVLYGIRPESVCFTPEMQRHNHMQLGLELMLSEGSSDMMVVHTVTNRSKRDVTLSLWAVTMMAPGGLEIIPQNRGGEQFLPNRVLVLWPYSNPKDQRLHWGQRFLTLDHSKSSGLERSSFKIGVDNLVGWAAYALDGLALLKRYVHNTRTPYPDFGASFETYLNADFLEMETLSPLTTIRPGETLRHVENFSLFRVGEIPAPGDGNALEAFCKKLGVS